MGGLRKPSNGNAGDNLCLYDFCRDRSSDDDVQHGRGGRGRVDVAAARVTTAATAAATAGMSKSSNYNTVYHENMSPSRPPSPPWPPAAANSSSSRPPQPPPLPPWPPRGASWRS